MAIDLKKMAKAKEREKRLLQRKAKVESQLSQLQKAQKEAARRLDSRRKTILGAITIKAVRKGLISEFSMREMIESLASEKDKETLRDFDFGVPETAVSGTPVTASSMDEFEPLDKRE